MGQKLRGSIARVFPDCVMQAQAVAFNMFLAFFPMLLFTLGVLSGPRFTHGEIREFPTRLRLILPPGSENVVYEFLVRQGVHPWRWISLGLGGSLLAGTQVLSGLMDGFIIIAGDPERPSFLRRQVRAFILFVLIIVPWVGAVVLTVFGRQVRGWLILELGLPQLGLPQLTKVIWAVVYLACVLILALGVLSVLYRFGRPRRRSGGSILPGAYVATVLWWAVGASFGLYVRHVPYGVIYGGLAAAIGLLLWMYMTAIVIFLGAAYNVVTDALPRGR